MDVTADLRRKGQLKLRGLISEIAEVHHACQSVAGQVVPGGNVEFEHIDHVVNALDHALVSIRTLDLEVFENSDATSYRAARERDGHVVRGLTAPRNAAVHSGEVIDPDLARAVGPLRDRFIVFPRWKQRAAIPANAFNRTSAQAIAAYDAAVAGRTVLDTFFDALSFFDRCDPTLLDRDTRGGIIGLPLAPLPIPGYCRLHPDWPSSEEVDANIRREFSSALPFGIRRRVDGYVRLPTGEMHLCGYTQLSESFSKTFTEPVAQVTADVADGYRYELALDGIARELGANGVALTMAGRSLDLSQLVDLTPIEPWSRWAECAANDAAYYRAARHPR